MHPMLCSASQIPTHVLFSCQWIVGPRTFSHHTQEQLIWQLFLINFPDHWWISRSNVVAIHRWYTVENSSLIRLEFLMLWLVAIGFNFFYHGFKLATSHAYFFNFLPVQFRTGNFSYWKICRNMQNIYIDPTSIELVKKYAKICKKCEKYANYAGMILNKFNLIYMQNMQKSALPWPTSSLLTVTRDLDSTKSAR